MVDTISNNRLIALDTETTGLSSSEGHRIIEIGAVEIINRRISGDEYHSYIHPQRNVGNSIRIHGISDDFLQDKPLFNTIAKQFFDYISGATLIIHQAAFDVGFINNEFDLVGIKTRVETICEIIDSIELSKSIHPRGQNNLDALARRYNIDLSKRAVHGALVDAQILAQVYLAMTGGQKEIFTNFDQQQTIPTANNITTSPTDNTTKPVVIFANQKEQQLDKQYRAFLSENA